MKRDHVNSGRSAEASESLADVRFTPKADICSAAKEHRYSVSIRGTKRYGTFGCINPP
jgi:hypothetical protein